MLNLVMTLPRTKHSLVSNFTKIMRKILDIQIQKNCIKDHGLVLLKTCVCVYIFKLVVLYYIYVSFKIVELLRKQCAFVCVQIRAQIDISLVHQFIDKHIYQFDVCQRNNSDLLVHKISTTLFSFMYLFTFFFEKVLVYFLVWKIIHG